VKSAGGGGGKSRKGDSNKSYEHRGKGLISSAHRPGLRVLPKIGKEKKGRPSRTGGGILEPIVTRVGEKRVSNVKGQIHGMEEKNLSAKKSRKKGRLTELLGSHIGDRNSHKKMRPGEGEAGRLLVPKESVQVSSSKKLRRDLHRKRDLDRSKNLSRRSITQKRDIRTDNHQWKGTRSNMDWAKETTSYCQNGGQSYQS